MQILNYIDGHLQAPISGKFLPNTNPATGQVYGEIPDSDERDIEQAYLAAKKAFPFWSQLSAHKRAEWLKKLADKIKANLNSLAQMEARDNGKPVRLASLVDIPRSAQNLEFFADEVMTFLGEDFGGEGKFHNFTQHAPLGVVGCISPWNLPLYLFTWKIAPALAMGNTVVAKPSEVTPATAFALSELMKEIQFPEGVLNIVHGLGPKVGKALVEHPQIKAISFTGSTATGKMIAAQAGATLKKYSLEMGGKNPTIVFADADFDQAVATATRAAFSNQGQICLCGSRIFVHREIYEKFKNAMAIRTQNIRLGDPMNEETQHGALVSKEHYEKVKRYIELARRDGAIFLAGEEKIDLPKDFENGFFLRPTLLEGLSSEHALNQEEIFGPVACLIPFDSEDEVIAMANSTNYGLAASVWTSDEARAQRVSSALESGIVWINCWMERDLRTPFGGVKESGVGREGGKYALNFFSEVKNICQKN